MAHALCGAVNVHGNGVGALLISPTGANFLVATLLKFPSINKLVKYEACIIGLKGPLDMSFKDLEVYRDSILIIIL